MVRSIERILGEAHGRYALATVDANLAITISGHLIDWDVEIKDDDGLIDVGGASPDEFVIPSSWIDEGETEVLVEMVAQVNVAGFSTLTAHSVSWFVDGGVIEARGFVRESTVPSSGEAVLTSFSGPSIVSAGEVLTVALGGLGTGTLQGAVSGSPTWAMVRRLGG